MKSTFNPQLGDQSLLFEKLLNTDDKQIIPVSTGTNSLQVSTHDTLDAYVSDDKTIALLNNDDPHYNPREDLDEEIRLSRSHIESPELESGRIKKPVITVTTLETATISFGMMLEEFSKGLVSTILLPISAGLSFFRAVCASIDAYREKSKRLAFRAGVEWAASAALVTASIGMAVGAVAFAVAAPALIVASYAVKTLYHFGASLYFGIKSFFMKTDTPAKKSKKVSYENKAKTHAILGLASLIVTGLSVVGLILNKLSFGALSIFTGVCAVAAVGVGAYQASKDPNKNIKKEEHVTISDHDSSENLRTAAKKPKSSLSSNPYLAGMVRSGSIAIELKDNVSQGYDTDPDDIKPKLSRTDKGESGDCLVDLNSNSPQFTSPL